MTILNVDGVVVVFVVVVVVEDEGDTFAISKMIAAL